MVIQIQKNVKFLCADEVDSSRPAHSYHTLEGVGTMAVELDSTISLHELNRIKQ